ESKLLDYVNDTKHFSMLRNLHMADYVTLVNGFSGVMSIFSSLRYCASPVTSYLYAAMLWIALGTFADVMDGKIARMRHKSSLVGQELDSLADLVSFGVAPATVAFAMGMQTVLDQILLGVFVLCGLTRLARFNVTVGSMKKDETGKISSFEGTPIPTSLLLVQVMAFWTFKGWVREALPLGVWNVLGLEVHTATLLFTLLGAAMASKTLKIPKL
ncbi:hypothetical protein BCR37DRAFT_345379, partial [Protomyces lactucae-debilis]